MVKRVPIKECERVEVAGAVSHLLPVYMEYRRKCFEDHCRGLATKMVKRFLSKIKVTETCWLFTGTKTKKGYGIITLLGIDIRVHRFMWILMFGIIPDGLHVLHTCDVRHCVRPSHLFLGTNDDNVNDKTKKGRARGPIRVWFGNGS